MNQIAVLEKDLTRIAPQLGEIIPPAAHCPPERMVRSIVSSCQRNPKLLDADRQTLFNAAWTLSSLGLVADGITNQGHLVPYKGKVQALIGFGGHTTIAARAGFTLSGDVIREGDRYDLSAYADGMIGHEPMLDGHAENRRIIGAYARLTSNHLPPMAILLDFSTIVKIQNVSQSPGPSWKQWFDQMAIKSAKNRLGKSSPLDALRLATAFDTQVQAGHETHINQDGAVVIDGDVTEVPPATAEEPTDAPTELIAPPTYKIIRKDGGIITYPSEDQYVAACLALIARMTTAKQLDSFQTCNGKQLQEYEDANPGSMIKIRDAAQLRRGEVT